MKLNYVKGIVGNAFVDTKGYVVSTLLALTIEISKFVAITPI